MTILPTTIPQAFIRLILIVIITAFCAWWLIPLPSITTAAITQKSGWQIPTINSPNNLPATYEKLRKLQLWGKEKNDTNIAGDNPATVKTHQWRFIGVVKEGDKGYMLLSDSTGKVSRHAVGATLPEGGQLISIENETIQVKNEDGIETLRLYRPR